MGVGGGLLLRFELYFDWYFVESLGVSFRFGDMIDMMRWMSFWFHVLPLGLGMM